MMSGDRRQGQRGLTLIEVLVAMLVMGTAAASAVTLLALHTRNVSSLQENVLGRIVADNAMVQAIAVGEGEGVRDDEGVVEVAGLRFTYEVIRRDPGLANLEEVAVEVRLSETDRVVAELSTLRPRQ